VLIDSGTGARVAEKEGGGRRKGRRRGKVEIVEDRPGKEGLEGVGVGAVNVYLVVFKDGIISVSRFLPPSFSSGWDGKGSKGRMALIVTTFFWDCLVSLRRHL
jgi:hypothetical protein